MDHGIVMVLSEDVVRVTVVQLTRALVFSVMVSSWFSFVFTCMHTHASHTHQAHPEANAHKYVLDFTRFGLIGAAPP